MTRQDGRSARTREALVEAHNRLVLEKRARREIGVREIVAEAGVGRSTFYDHYASAEDIHLQALARPLALLADAAAGQGDPARVANLLRHFWENRARARRTLMGRTGERVGRLLAGLVAERIDGESLAIPAPLAAAQVAAAAFAPLRGWLTGAASCDAETLARAICSAGVANRQALRKDPG